MFFFFHELLRVIALRPSVCNNNASEPPQGRPRAAPGSPQGRGKVSTDGVEHRYLSMVELDLLAYVLCTRGYLAQRSSLDEPCANRSGGMTGPDLL